MTFLSPDEVLFHAGSLISTDGNLVAPYDLEHGEAPLTAHYSSTQQIDVNFGVDVSNWSTVR